MDATELAQTGASLRPRSRFAKFTNLPELQQMFRSYADVQTRDAPPTAPAPRWRQGHRRLPDVDEQHTIQEALVARNEAIRSGKVKPWEDNALAITTDGRKLALDARILSAKAEDFRSKINALVANVAAIWQRTLPTRSTQLIFADLGINATPWGTVPRRDRQAGAARHASAGHRHHW